MKTFALALGGGGARGLAHIAAIEALDDMGIKPVAIAGTSIGSLIGASYAAGMSGKEIRHHVIAFAHDWSNTRRRLMTTRAGKFADLLSGRLSQATQMDAEKFCEQFLPGQVPDDFSALKIPLIAMATDLHRRSETPITSGPLRPALAASIAIPGLFRPVVIDGRVLIDGGATNPMPFDKLAGRADRVVAVDVHGIPEDDRVDIPNSWEALYATALVMGGAIIAAKLAHAAPDLVIRPNVSIFRTLGFLQASAIIRAAEAVKDEIKDKLGELLNAAP
ncbi:MAG TPA: patatin-like phospholipase family protein [Xanthobacteraceae bacterium]|nr:patatin-like phospholipase family protein [Xanthobacteraceae bacterium]